MKLFRSFLPLIGLLWLAAISIQGETTPMPASFNVLVFSKTLLYRHASIINGIAAIRKLGAENGFSVDATENSSVFTATNLARYRAVVFLSTSGDILNDEQQVAFQNYLTSGGGLAAVHAAIAGGVATEGGWGWYGQLCCTEFTNHSAIVQAAVQVEDPVNPSTAHLPKRWVRADEWYNFITNPRGKVRVLASLNESTYKGGTMSRDHPVAWCRRIENGRFWYTALGHTEASYTEPHFLQHLLGGIQIAAGVKPAGFTPNGEPLAHD